MTFDDVGIYINELVFLHGQLYVALSRSRSPKPRYNLTIAVSPSTLPGSRGPEEHQPDPEGAPVSGRVEGQHQEVLGVGGVRVSDGQLHREGGALPQEAQVRRAGRGMGVPQLLAGGAGGQPQGQAQLRGFPAGRFRVL